MRGSDEKIHGEVIDNKSSASVTRWIRGSLLTSKNLFSCVIY